MQKLASGGDVELAVGVGEQSVVADPMKARRQHVQQEAAHELRGMQRHELLARAAIFAVVLPAEGDAAIIVGDEPGVGDGDAVRVARQVRQHRFGSCEGALGVDDPLALTQGAKPVGKGIGIGEVHVLAEELELPVTVQAL